MNQFKEHPFQNNHDKAKEYGVSLLGALHAQKEFQKLRPPNDIAGGSEAFLQLHEKSQEIFETNIIALAATARANDEGYYYFSKHIERNPHGVGFLIENNENKPLNGREACNKIIHALEARIEWQNIDSHPVYEEIYKSNYHQTKQNFITPILCLSGEKGKVKWSAEINLNQWVHAVVFCT